MPDHPRRCGALASKHCGHIGALGSSPQVRGTSSLFYCVDFVNGIIPAGAGHLALAQKTIRSNWDHPRRCGALSCPRTRRRRLRGSSPQVRGTFTACRLGAADRRIIPAGAGHFMRLFKPLLTGGDHPRRCGALLKPTPTYALLQGSSPQVRGTCLWLQESTRIFRIIPAGAGHFSAPTRSMRAGRDHPRRCGALLAPPKCTINVPGSSPQVRGTCR